MKRVNARTFLNYSTAELWENLQGEFILVCDDGELAVDERDVHYSSYVWDYHRKYPHTPLQLKHVLKHSLGKGRLGSGTHLKLIRSALFSTYDAYVNSVPDKLALLDDLRRLVYRVTNNIYNDLTYKLEEHVTSIDLLDFLDLAEHPGIDALLRTEVPKIAPLAEGDELDRNNGKMLLTNINEKAEQIILKDPVLDENPLAKAARSKIVNMKQLLQCVVARGFLSDMDSHEFRKPILRGFLHGLRSLGDAMMESRSAAMALAFSTEPLQQSEYFSRRQQLLCQHVQRLHRCDCGSTHYLMWKVRDEEWEGGVKTRDTDLVTLAGKYYFDDVTQKVKVIREEDRHLIGQTLKVRSVVAGCMIKDPYGVCEVCYGETSLAAPRKTNIGQASSTRMAQDISQNVLSTKHLVGSAIVDGISLKGQERVYLSAELNGSTYRLSPSLKGKKVFLKFHSDCARGLPDVNLVDDVRKLNLTRVSEFRDISIQVTDGRVTMTVPLRVSVSNRNASFTHAMLAYVKRYGWTINTEGLYMVDMADWKYEEPFLVLPLRQFNMGDHQAEIASILESTVSEMQKRENEISPADLVAEVHDLINQPKRRLSINLAIIDVVIWSVMVRSTIDGDYAPPKPWTPGGVGALKPILANRSLAATMAYERQRKALVDPASFVQKKRPAHIFDALLMPEEVLGRKYGR